MARTKVNRLRTRRRYTLEELFDAIKEERFTAGMPSLAHQGLSQFIVFPAIDLDNQVRVSNAALTSPSDTFCVQRGEQVGAIAGEGCLSYLVDGWHDSGFASQAGHALLCEQLAETTRRELEGLGL